MAYTITGRKCGTVRFEPETVGNIQTEQVSMSSKVTSNPIESGGDINDHVIKDPMKFTISGVIIGGQQAQSTLQNMRERRDIVSYTGRNRVSNLVITSLTFDASAKNAKGCSFKATFQQVNISSAEVVEVGAYPTMTQQDSGKSSSNPTQTKKTSSDGLKTTVSSTIPAAHTRSTSAATTASPPAAAGPPAGRRRATTAPPAPSR